MENKSKRLKLDHESHWAPFWLEGKVYDLSHLDAHIVEYTQPKKVSILKGTIDFMSLILFIVSQKITRHSQRKREEYLNTKHGRIRDHFVLSVMH